MVVPFQIGHVGPYELLGTLSPFQFVTAPTKSGIPCGTLRNGVPFYLDPHLYMRLGLTGGTIIQILGERDAGKSGLAKMLGTRNMGLKAPGSSFSRRFATEDTRRNQIYGDYELMAKGLGYNYIDLSKYRTNPIDHRMNMDGSEQQSIMRSLMQSVNGKPMTIQERIVLLGLIHVLNTEAPEDTSPDTLQLVSTSLTYEEYELFRKVQPDRTIERIGKNHKLASRLERPLNLTKNDFNRAINALSDMLLLLLEEYGDTFGGDHSLYDPMSAPMVAFDLTGLDEDTIPLVEMMLWTWRNSAIRRNDHNLIAHMESHDENWKRWENLVYGTNMVNRLKKIRGSGVVIIKIAHGPTDVMQVGDAGSRERALAMTGLKETDIWMLGRMARSEIEPLQHQIKLPQKFLDRLPQLGQGDFIVVIGEKVPPFEIHVEPTEFERNVIMTNQSSEAMV